MFKKGDVVAVKAGRDLIFEGRYGRVVSTAEPSRALVMFNVGKNVEKRSYHYSELELANDETTTITFIDPDLLEQVRAWSDDSPFEHISDQAIILALAWIGLEHVTDASWSFFETCIPDPALDNHRL